MARVSLAVMAGLLLATSTRSVHAEDATVHAEDATVHAEDAPRHRVLATTAAVLPGLAIHGLGHYVAGEKKTAYRLLAWQGIGLGLMAVSGATIGLSGGSRYGNEITIPALVTGSGIFINTALADIYGASGGRRKSRFGEAPAMSARLGYGYVDDPQFAYAHFSVAAASVQRGPVATTPSLWTALGADNQRARLPIHYRFLDNHKGDFLQANTAVTYHRYGDDGFSSLAGELSLGMRTNLSRIGPSLAGAFTGLTVGWALQRTAYDLPEVSPDTIGLLLTRFGYGIYLPKDGELEAYYAHRRDGYTAGLSPSSRNGSGFLGHFGLSLRQPVSRRFALQARTEIGAAWLTTVGVEIRQQGRP